VESVLQLERTAPRTSTVFDRSISEINGVTFPETASMEISEGEERSPPRATKALSSKENERAFATDESTYKGD